MHGLWLTLILLAVALIAYLLLWIVSIPFWIVRDLRARRQRKRPDRPQED